MVYVKKVRPLGIFSICILLFLLLIPVTGYAQLDLDNRQILIEDNTIVKSGHSEAINEVLSFADGDRIATSSKDNTIKIWDTTKQDIIYQMATEEFGLYSMDYTNIESESEDPTSRTETQHIIASGGKKKITLWNANDGSRIKEWTAHKDIINSIYITKDNKYIISSSKDRTVKVWDFNTYQLIMETDTTSSINYALSDSGNNLIYLALSNGDIEIRNFANGGLADTIKGHTSDVNHLTIDYDTRFIYSVSDDGILRTWTLDGFMEVSSEDFGTPLNEIIIDKANQRLIIGSISGVFTYSTIIDEDEEDLSGRDTPYSISDRDKMKHIAYDESNGVIYGAGSQGVVVVFNSELEETDAYVKPVSLPLKTVSVSPTGDYITASGEENDIYYWNAVNGELVSTITNLSDRGTKSIIMTDDDQFITADYDNHLRMYQIDQMGEGANIVDIGFDTDLHQLHYDEADEQLVFSVNNEVYMIGIDDLGLVTESDIADYRIITASFSIYKTIPSSEEDAIYLMDWEGNIEKWDYQTNSMISRIGNIGDVDTQNLFLINDNESVIFAGNQDGGLYKINLLTLDKTELVLNTDLGSIHALYYHQGKQMLYVGGEKNIIAGYSLSDDMVKYSLRGHYSSIESIMGRTSTNQIVGASEDGSISLWNYEDVGISGYLRAFDNGQWLAYTPDGYHKPENQPQLVSFYDESGNLVDDLNLVNNESVLLDRLNGGSLQKEVDREIREIADILNDAWDDIRAGDLEDAQNKLLQADNLIEPDVHQLALPFYYQVQAEFYATNEQYRTAIETFRTALDLAEVLSGLEHLKGNVNRRIGDVYQTTEDFQNAITYYLNAMTYAKSLSTEEEVSLYLNIAQTYLSLNQNDKAIEYYDRAIELDLSPERKVKLLLEIGDMYFSKNYYNTSIKYYVQASEYALSDPEKAEVSGKIGDAYYQLGQFEQAIRHYQNQLDLVDTGDYDKLLNAYDDLGKAYQSNRDFLEAYTTYANKMDRIAFNDTEEIIDTYYKLIDISIKLRDFQTALQHLETVREFIPEEDIESRIKNYERTAEIYEEFNQIQRAVRNYTYALNLINPDENFEDYYRISRNIALLYERDIQYQNALDRLSTLSEKIPNTNYEKRFENYMDIARIYLKMDDNQSASVYFDRGASLARQNELITIYDYYEEVGKIYEGINLNREALQYYQQAYNNIPENLTRRRLQNLIKQAELYEKLNEIETAINISINAITTSESGDYETQWALYNTLGRLYTKKESYTESINSYKTASEKALQMNDNKKYAYSIFQIGIVNEITDKNQQAINYYEEAVEAMERSESLTDEETNLLGDMLFELSDLLRQEKQYEEAKEQGNKCLRVYQEINSYQKAKALLNLGNIYYEKGEYQEVKSYYQQALQNAEEDNNTEYYAKALNNLAVMMVKEGDYEQAIEYYEQAIELKELDSDFQSAVNTYWNMAIVYERMSRFSKAIDVLKEAIFLIKNYKLENGDEFAQYIAELEYIREELIKTTGTTDTLEQDEADEDETEDDEDDGDTDEGGGDDGDTDEGGDDGDTDEGGDDGDTDEGGDDGDTDEGGDDGDDAGSES